VSFRSDWPYLVAFALSAILLVLLFLPLTKNEPYGYDSADYMYAGTQGFWKNYTDAGALPFQEFVAQGFEARKHPEKKAELSKLIRTNEDISFYRHFHGPMYAYWIALWTSLGVSEEAEYRNAGLILHIATSLVVMLAFWMLFPRWPRLAGLLAGILYLFNRTGLVTGTEITQHLVFVFLTAVNLWLLALFCRSLNVRYWYATMACLGLALATLESAFMIGLTIVVSIVWLWRAIAERWPDPRRRLRLFINGIGVFAAALFVAWPAGVYKLTVVRGYVYLAYMALVRKTFSPVGPLQVWQMKFAAAPWEIGAGAAGLIAALLLWRRLEYRREALPWLAYAVIFVVVTLKVTLEFTHYRGTIALTMSFATAIAFAHLWSRSNAAGRTALVAAVCVPLFLGAKEYYDEKQMSQGEPSAVAEVLQYVETTGLAKSGKTLYAPASLVPSLHFYYPHMAIEGYDQNSSGLIANAVTRDPGTNELLCPAPFCNALPSEPTQRRQLVSAAWQDGPLYAVQVR
jgi:hypothetical protein